MLISSKTVPPPGHLDWCFTKDLGAVGLPSGHMKLAITGGAAKCPAILGGMWPYPTWSVSPTLTSCPCVQLVRGLWQRGDSSSRSCDPGRAPGQRRWGLPWLVWEENGQLSVEHGEGPPNSGPEARAHPGPEPQPSPARQNGQRYLWGPQRK